MTRIKGRRPGFLVSALLVALVAGGGTTPLVAQNGNGLLTLDGRALDPELLEGDAIVVFFATWSPRCRDIVERAQQLHQRWGSRAKVLLVAFQEEEEDVRGFLAGEETDVQVTRDADGSFSKRHGITTLPSLLVLDNGAVGYRGRMPADVDSVLQPIFG